MTVRTSGERLNQFAGLGRVVSGAFTLEDTLHEITTAVASLRPDLACVIRLVDREAGGYRLVAVTGIAADGLRPVIRFGEGVTHAIAESRQAVSLPDLRGDLRAVDPDWFAAHGLTVSDSAPGRGTALTVYLPLWTEETPP